MPEKLRVLFVGHTYTVGLNQQKLDALSRTGEVELALLAPRSWRERDWGHSVHLEHAYSTFRTFPASVVFNSRPGAFLFDPATVLATVRSFRPHLLQVEQEVFSLAAFELSLVARAFHIPIVLFGWENLNRPLRFPRRLTRRFVLKTASGIVCGNCENQRLLSRWGYSGPTLVLPQLGVDPQLFYPRPHRNGTGEFVVGFLGRFLHQKGLDLLLDAAALLRGAGLPIHLYFCGAGPHEQQFRAHVSRLGIDRRVTWQPTAAHIDVPEVLSQFHVLVLPSRTVPTWKEQFGHVLIEAMAMGIPVVGSGSGEIPNVIGRPDLVFPENDSFALSNILFRLYQDAAFYQDVAQFGLQRVRANFTHERIASQLLNFYDHILRPSV